MLTDQNGYGGYLGCDHHNYLVGRDDELLANRDSTKLMTET